MLTNRQTYLALCICWEQSNPPRTPEQVKYLKGEKGFKTQKNFGSEMEFNNICWTSG